MHVFCKPSNASATFVRYDRLWHERIPALFYLHDLHKEFSVFRDLFDEIGTHSGKCSNEMKRHSRILATL